MNTILSIVLPVIINIVISLGLIYTFHSLWEYMRDTYTPRKTKNLVEMQFHKYKQILEDISAAKLIEPTISHADIERMDNDLTAFMNSQFEST